MIRLAGVDGKSGDDSESADTLSSEARGFQELQGARGATSLFN